MKNLKRLLVWCFAIVGLAGFALVGCGKSQANNVAVTAYVWDSTQEQYVQAKADTVDAHNGLVLDIPETIPDGKEFYGWSTSQNWQEGSSDFVIEGSYVRYADVKNVARDGKISLYPAFKTKVEYYFVFGVYVNSKSGIGDEQVSAIRTAVLNYLEAQQGATAEQLALVDIRHYTDSGVADYGAKIMQQGDVDVLVGCGVNISTQGGVEIVTKTGTFTINNNKSGRVLALLNYDDLSIAVYNWFQTYINDNYTKTGTDNFTVENFVKVEYTATYVLGEHHHADAVAPDSETVFNNQKLTLPDAPEGEGEYFFAGWKVGDATKLKAAGEQITLTESVTITAQFRSGYNITYSKGLASRAASDAVIPEDELDLAVGTTRNLASAPAAKPGFTFAGWRVNDAATLKNPGDQVTLTEDLFITAEYTVDTTIDLTVTIAYYAKTSASGLNETIMANVKTALEEYLASVGVTEGYNSISVTGYGADKNVESTGADINADINNSVNVGIVLGFASNLQSTGGVNYTTNGDRQDGFTMGTKSGRYVYRLNNTAIANVIYDWMIAPESTFLAAVINNTPAA